MAGRRGDGETGGLRSVAPSPSAWDTPPEGEEGTEPEPDVLQEWYRYVDSLARPSRRQQDEEDGLNGDAGPEEDEGTDRRERAGSAAAPRPWAEPWSPPAREAVVDSDAALEIVAQLAPSPPPPAPVAWAPSLPDLAVPDLTQFIPVLDEDEPEAAPAPVTGDRASPRLLAPGSGPSASPPSPSAPPQTGVTALVPVPGSDRSETPFGSGRGQREEAAAQVPSRRAEPSPSSELPGIREIREQWPQYAERLRRVPASEVAQNSYKTPFKETREELIERLLDPPLTLEETARLLGVCPTTVRRYTNRGWLQHYRTPGNQRRFRLSAVLSFLDEHGETSLLDRT